MHEINLRTTQHSEMIDITGRVRKILRETGLQTGFCIVYVPHTTAGVTINENADPDVPADILSSLNRIVPLENAYRHREGNSAAHVKSSLVGASQVVPVEDGDLVLGTWQALFFCEFDGPRTRKALVKFLEGKR
jgi:secondary thiamine-phosphate synthase enzyme